MCTHQQSRVLSSLLSRSRICKILRLSEELMVLINKIYDILRKIYGAAGKNPTPDFPRVAGSLIDQPRIPLVHKLESVRSG